MNVERLLSALDEKREGCISRVTKWSPEQAAFRPRFETSNGPRVGWSATEVIEHLVLAESGIATVIERAIASYAPGMTMLGAVGREGLLLPLLSWARAQLITTALRRPIRVAAPTDRVLPKGQKDLLGLIDEWRVAGGRLRSLKTASLPVALDRIGVFPHPIGGLFTLPDTLKFLTIHIVHHGFQLDRIERAWGKAVSAP